MATEPIPARVVRRILTERRRLLEFVGGRVKEGGVDMMRAGAVDAADALGGAVNVASQIRLAANPKHFLWMDVQENERAVEVVETTRRGWAGAAFVKLFRAGKHRGKGRLRKTGKRGKGRLRKGADAGILSEIGALLQRGRWTEEVRLWPYGEAYAEEVAESTARAVEEYMTRERSG